MRYIAQDGERLDSVYFRFYGLEFNQRQYDDFLLKNAQLLLKDTLDGGDVVIVEVIAKEQERTEGLYGIDV